MRGVPRQIAVLLAAAALAAGVAACGGGGSSTTTSGEGEATAPSTAPRQASKPAGAPTTKPSGGSASGGSTGGSAAGGGGGGSSAAAGGAAAFESKGGDNSIQRFGGEAGGSELEQAAASLHAFLDARAAGDWTKACANMAAGVTKSLQQLSGSAQRMHGGGHHAMGCPQLMAAMSAGMPAYLRHDLTQAKVGALRVEGARAFLLYRGAHRTNYFMPMSREGGQWKVAALAASALP